MAQNNGDNEMKGEGVPPPYTGGGPPYTGGGPPYTGGGPPYTAGGPPPVVMTQPGIVVPMVVSNQMGPKPSPTTCRSCNHQIVTRVELKSSTKTHLFALLLCCVFCPCACLPYCLDSCHNADHYCPNCNAYIGSYSN